MSVSSKCTHSFDQTDSVSLTSRVVLSAHHSPFRPASTSIRGFQVRQWRHYPGHPAHRGLPLRQRVFIWSGLSPTAPDPWKVSVLHVPTGQQVVRVADRDLRGCRNDSVDRVADIIVQEGIIDSYTLIVLLITFLQFCEACECAQNHDLKDLSIVFAALAVVLYLSFSLLFVFY